MISCYISLKVSLELAVDKKHFSSKSKSGKRVVSPGDSPWKAPVSGGDDCTGPQGDEYSVDFQPESDSRRDPSPVAISPAQSIVKPRARARSTSPQSSLLKSTHRTHEKDILLHSLLMVPDGKDFKCAPLQPNVYLNCRLFGSDETTKSVVSWGQTHPTFSLVQVSVLMLPFSV